MSDDLADAAQWLYGEPTIYESNELRRCEK